MTGDVMTSRKNLHVTKVGGYFQRGSYFEQLARKWSSNQFYPARFGCLQKVLSGATWYSKSAQVQNGQIGEYQPLVHTINRNYSCNEIYQGKDGTETPIFPGHHINARRALWPSRSNLPLNLTPKTQSLSQMSVDLLHPLIPPIPEHEDGVSWITASFLLINAALGIGILNFPAAYDLAGGIVSATCTQLIMLVLIVLTMLILAHCSDVNLDVTYHDVLLSMCGRKAQKLAAVSITCTCYGVCVAIFIIIGDQLDRLTLNNFSHYEFKNNSCICLLLAVFLGCFWIDILSPLICWVSGNFCHAVSSVPNSLWILQTGYKNVDIKHEPESISQLLVVVPVLCLAYQCQEVVVPVYACMRHRTLGNFTKSCCFTMFFLFMIYSIIGCFGYLTFGSMVSPNVMKMYNAEDPVVMIGIGALILKMVVTYPVLALCGRVPWMACTPKYSDFQQLNSSKVKEPDESSLQLYGSVPLSSALNTSSIGTVIHALGSISAANVFIYPGICLMQVTLQTDPGMRRKKELPPHCCSNYLGCTWRLFFGLIIVDSLLNNSTTKTVESLCT
ncbi:putative sodium-coupled neutral amino acid transporter 7 [Caerostris extrusa]|uniref:Sodium-coupled neutral amino acid transporter 7 n=1 Tax=Caerostris extrusa TaxID=172846 RepID=A0AAV4UXW9_CAEEX|nr:putative sodium-coupled neutral amino acid transporter 7 [Caerostris extrusa]